MTQESWSDGIPTATWWPHSCHDLNIDQLDHRAIRDFVPAEEETDLLSWWFIKLDSFLPVLVLQITIL